MIKEFLADLTDERFAPDILEKRIEDRIYANIRREEERASPSKIQKRPKSVPALDFKKKIIAKKN